MEDDKGFQKRRMVKRRLMEAQGGAQVRRLHIVYVLSRIGHTEHPHLIRVHHLSRNGVRLRDIKRWLGEVRGKDMAESFAWSYKRRYKTGYVWQDLLLDDDLITPISDNEYILKGSEISSTINYTDLSYSGKRIPMQKEQFSLQEPAKDNHKTSSKEENQSPSSEASMYVSTTKSSSEIKESSPTSGSEASMLTDDPGKLEVLDENSGTLIKHQRQEANSSPLCSTVILNKKRANKVEMNGKIISAKSGSSDKPHFRKSKSYSNGASHMFRNFITCGAADTNDSAVVMINKQNYKRFLNMCTSDQRNVHSADICIRGKAEGFHGTSNWTQYQWSSSKKSCNGVKDSAKSQRQPSSAVYKPLNGPKCSQCGKPFKPEKLHAHMKSCKGMKALGKSSNPAISAAESVSQISAESRNDDSVSGYFLTH